MTFAESITRGSGTWEFYLRIDGFPLVPATTSEEPTSETWYRIPVDPNPINVFDGVVPGLDRNQIKRECFCAPGEVWPETSVMRLDIADPDGLMAAALRSAGAVASTVLTSTLSDSSSTVTVAGTSGFTAGDTIYIDGEAIDTTALTDTTFTGCSRGHHGSEAVEHTVDTSLFPPCEPEVFAGPVDLDGRRVVLYGAERVNGTLSATTQLWVGYINGADDQVPGKVTIEVAHVLDLFRRGSVLGWAAAGRLRGLYVPNYTATRLNLRWGRLEVYDATNLSQTIDVVADGTATFYADWRAFFDACKTAIEAVSGWHCDLTAEGAVRIWCDNLNARVDVGGGLLWQLLGFDIWSFAAFWVTGADRTAPHHIAETFAVVSVAGTAFRPRLYLRDGEATRFVESGVQLVFSDGGDERVTKTRQVTNISTAAGSNYLQLAYASAEGEGEMWPIYVLARPGETPPAVKQTWNFDGELADAVRMCWSGQVYTGSMSTSYTVPKRWLPGPALRDDDVDWNELRRLCRLLPEPLNSARLVIGEPRQVDELLGGLLMAAGISPFVKCDGSVGWARIRVPSVGEALTSVGQSVIDADRAPEAKTSKLPVINAVHFKVAETWRWLDDDNARSIYIVDTTSLQRYGQRLALDPLDPVQAIDKAARCFDWHGNNMRGTIAELEEVIASHFRGHIGALMRTPRRVLPLPVTPGASDVECWEAVSVTSGWGVDGSTGEQGLSSQLGIVLGWDRTPKTRRATDILHVLLIDESLGAIAPAARGTSWNAGTKVLTIADATLYKGSDDTTDIDYVEVGDEVRFFTADSESPSSWGPVGVTAVSRTAVNATLTLDADPFSGAFPSAVICVFGRWTECVTAQQGEGWAFVGDDSDGQIQDDVAAQPWSL